MTSRDTDLTYLQCTLTLLRTEQKTRQGRESHPMEQWIIYKRLNYLL